MSADRRRTAGRVAAACLALALLVGGAAAGPAGSVAPPPGAIGAAGPAGSLLAQLTPEEKSLPAAGEPTREEAARQLLDVALSFEERGELTAARLLLREITERYDGTMAAAQALERLAALEGRPDFVPGSLPPPEAGVSPDSLLRIGRNAPRGAAGRGAISDPEGRPRGAAAAAPMSPTAGRTLDQSGRVSVIAYTTLITTWAALAIPIYADAEGPTGYGLALLLGPPAGLVTSLYLTRDRQVTAPQADLVVLGGNLGAWHGLALGGIREWAGHEKAGASALFGLLGTGTAALLVSRGGVRETTAALPGLAAPVGIWLGLAGAQVLGGSDGASDDTRLGSMLVAGDVALIGSVLAAPHLTLSRTRARLIGLGGAVGAGVGASMALIFDVSGDRSAWSLIGAGTLGGLAGALALTADYDVEHGFTDPAQAERSAGLWPLPLHLVARPVSSLPAQSPSWAERLRERGAAAGPGVGLTLIEARF